MFASKIAIVTGASAGIGLAVARKLVGEGARVALVARTRARLEEAARALGPSAVPFPLDVGDLEKLARLPTEVRSRLGGLDLLVNNAGLHWRGPMLTRTPAELAEMVNVNLSAPIVLTRAAAELMGPGSAIVNVASLAGRVAVRGAATYSGTKAGLRLFSAALAEELAPRGISVGVVSPGPVDTEFFMGELAQVTPVTFSQPMSTADQVADAVLECLRSGRREVAMPWLSGKLTTLGYLSPAVMRWLRPLLERVGARKKAEYAARHGGTASRP